MADKPTVALLGTGIMGSAMGRNLLKAGFPLRVWNRTQEKAQPLAEQGAVLGTTPADAVESAQVIITMLRDGDAVLHAMNEAAPKLGRGQIWAQMSTTGPQAVPAEAAFADEYGLTLVDAPVLGTKQPAEQGQLVILAAGPQSVRPVVQSVFDVLGKKILWVDDNAARAVASKLKLVANNWVIGLTNAVAETMALAKGAEVDARAFLDAVEGGPLDVPYLRIKAKAILENNFEPSFALENATKDAALIVALAHECHVSLPVAEAMLARMRKAIEMGHGDEDIAATYFASFDR
ncbi:NAD(P)-dependent oxidoreductase [Pseudonocardia sp. K10HN5]|uniref:NAD(P)-dependent oxidoreductase n=1 Tax=Pseudonocardia acidicola TaxID=2724939 RepID=A0ABX1SH04_9PSEU|nr:NAD(P)-dependent oxidoreductase [Pseudonocardia acidicola]